MEQSIKAYVGLDVHKDSIAIAVAEAGRGAGRLIGQIAHDVPKLLKALARLGKPGALHVVYEAGLTGYGLQRALSAKGYRCEVIAPSLIPKRAGDRRTLPPRLGLASHSGRQAVRRFRRGNRQGLSSSRHSAATPRLLGEEGRWQES